MERGQKNLTLDLVPKGVKGISNIIVTLIMVVLVLVAVGIVWSSIQSNLSSGTENIDLNARCLEVNIQSTALVCSGTNPDVCTVTVERSAGGDAFTGLKIIYTTDTASDGNYVQTEQGNVVPLATKTISQITTEGLTGVTKVEVIPYFTDSSGAEAICPTK